MNKEASPVPLITRRQFLGDCIAVLSAVAAGPIIDSLFGPQTVEAQSENHDFFYGDINQLDPELINKLNYDNLELRKEFFSGKEIALAATFGHSILNHIEDRSNQCGGGAHTERAKKVVENAMRLSPEDFAQSVKDWAVGWASQNGSEVIQALFFLVEEEAGKPVVLIVHNPEIWNGGPNPGTAFRLKETYWKKIISKASSPNIEISDGNLAKQEAVYRLKQYLNSYYTSCSTQPQNLPETDPAVSPELVTERNTENTVPAKIQISSEHANLPETDINDLLENPLTYVKVGAAVGLFTVFATLGNKSISQKAGA